MSLLQKARFLTNLTVASREKETGLLTVLTFFQWTQIMILKTGPIVQDERLPTPIFLFVIVYGRIYHFHGMFLTQGSLDDNAVGLTGQKFIGGKVMA